VTVLTFLIPVSLFLGGLGLVAFLWMLRSNQFDDPDGQAHRVLSDRWDERPAPPPRDDEPERNALDDPEQRP
jgi:cbb3-type cytochrome oxidase maturation protein